MLRWCLVSLFLVRHPGYVQISVSRCFDAYFAWGSVPSSSSPSAAAAAHLLQEIVCHGGAAVSLFFPHDSWGGRGDEFSRLELAHGRKEAFTLPLIGIK